MSIGRPFTCYYWKVDRRYTFRAHSHSDRYELIVGLTGELTLAIADRSWKIAPGRILLLSPGTHHGIWKTGSLDTTYFNATFAGSDRLFHELAQRGPLQIPKNCDAFWLRRETRDRVQYLNPASEAWLMGKIYALCAELVLFSNSRSALSEKKVAPGHFGERLQALVESQPDQLHRRKHLAAYFGFTDAGLSMRAKRSTGHPLMKLYDQVKCAQARRFLQRGFSVKATAEACGFANAFHFSRKFKSVFGLRPSQIREE
ncbi:MAG: helix-turn-helix domain-containing protein [Spirochaetes bacterium]|nr:helix-turn-helix domain-containing protein [Spirochaetota bacterium]